MVDTVRSLSALQTLLADNTAGDISAQAARDLLVSARAWGIGFEETSDDVVWDAAADVVGDGTTLAISGSETITEQFGRLDVTFSGQSSNDLGGVLFSHSFSTGDKFVVPVGLAGLAANFTWAGIMFTDGVSDSSNVVAGVQYQAGANSKWMGSWSGTLTNFSTAEAEAQNLSQHFYWSGAQLHIGLEYTSSNTFQVTFGGGYYATTTFGLGTASVTMTPTHVGVLWTKDGTAGTGAISYGSIRKVA